VPNIKSAKKRVEISNKERLMNNSKKSSMKTAIKKAAKSSKEEATEALKNAYKKIDKAAKCGIITKKTAARKKSNLTKKVNQID